MADRPIIFSSAMIRALLEGRKTQTRRLIKPQPMSEGIKSFGESWAFKTLASGGFSGVTADQIRRFGVQSGMTPYAIGDRLWVRETWHKSFEFNRLIYRADAYEDGRTVPYEMSNASGFGGGVGEARIDRWRSPIHMPRSASRLTLTVTDVRVQRLQEISEEDARAEGIVWDSRLGAYHVPGLPHPDPAFASLYRPTAREMFAALWDTIHGSGAWLADPWIVAPTFTVEKRNIDA